GRVEAVARELGLPTIAFSAVRGAGRDDLMKVLKTMLLEARLAAEAGLAGAPAEPEGQSAGPSSPRACADSGRHCVGRSDSRGLFQMWRNRFVCSPDAWHRPGGQRTLIRHLAAGAPTPPYGQDGPSSRRVAGALGAGPVFGVPVRPRVAGANRARLQERDR